MTIKRRDFLRMGSFLTASVATLGVAGCNSSSTSSSSEAAPPAEATGGNWQFPQSVGSGDPQAESIILWTRVVPSGLTATAVSTTDVGVRLQVSADPGNTVSSTSALTGTLVADIVLPALSDFDGTVRHKLTGLTPGTTYYYQFIAGTVLSKIGRFKTPAASATALKFAFITCQDWSYNHWGAFADIAQNQTDLDFIVHLGDYIYETDPHGGVVNGVPSAEAAHGQLTFPQGAPLPAPAPGEAVPGGNYAAFPNDYRYLYKTYRSDPRLQAVHEQFPVVAIWDDHEFSDDCWGDAETYSDDNQLQPTRRRAANQAWYEYTAADVSFDTSNPAFTDIKIYRTLNFGGLADLILTDERLYRADHLIPETTLEPGTDIPLGRINTRYLVPEADLKGAELGKEALGASGPGGDPLQYVTMLGGTQRVWWMQQMQASTATWRIWGNEVTMMRLGINGTNAIATLFALNGAASLASIIGSTATNSTGGNIPVAAAIIAGSTSYPNPGNTVAGGAAQAVAVAAGGATSFSASLQASMVGAAVNAGLSVAQASIVVTAFIAATLAAPAGTATQLEQAAFATIRSNVETYKAQSVPGSSPVAYQSYFLETVELGAPGTGAKIAEFFQKFVLNADSWDGYRAERQILMQFLEANNISRVVNTTGDLHAFLAGNVYDTFPGEVLTITGPDASGQYTEATSAASGNPVVVDLVTAGISSTSWFQYVSQAVAVLDPNNQLVGKLVYVPVSVPAIPANGLFGGSPAIPAFTASLNMIDYTMGRTAPATASDLAAQLRGQIWQQLAANGVPEYALAASAAGVEAGIAANSTFQSQALPLAQSLAALGAATNPWLQHIDTDAQGYSVINLTASTLTCTFNKVNPLVGSNSPTNNNTYGTSIVSGVTTITVDAATFPAMTIS